MRFLRHALLLERARLRAEEALFYQSPESDVVQVCEPLEQGVFDFVQLRLVEESSRVE